MDIFNAASLNVIREEVHTQAGENIKRHQKKQQHDYESRNKSSASNDIYIGADVLLRNNLLPNLLPNGCCFRYHQKRFGHIEEQNDKELNIKYKQAQLNLFFFRDSDGINDHQDLPEDKIDQSSDDCIENPINDTIQNKQPLDEK